MRLWTSRFAGAVAAFVVTAAVFLPSSCFNLIALDDPDYVILNDHMQQGPTLDNIKWAFELNGYAGNWHPLCWLSLMADAKVCRADGMPLDWWRTPWNRVSKVMHFHNVILHAANAALLFLLMSLIVKRFGHIHPLWLLAVTLLWSLHPLRVEVVCWVSERKELLSVFFMLLSLISYLKDRYVPSLICAALALMAKPVAVTLPAVILAWDWILCGRARWLRTLPFMVLSAASCVLTMIAQSVAIKCGADGGIAPRLAAIFGSPLVYLRQTAVPYGLSAAYEVSTDIRWGLVAAGGVFAATVIGLGIWWLVGKRRRWLDVVGFALAWCYVGLIPMLGIVKVGWQEHSDRYTYWIGCGACASLALAMACFGHDWWRSLLAWISKVDGRPFDGERARRWIMAGSYILVALLVTVSVPRMMVWKNHLSFIRDAIPKSWHPDFVRIAVDMLKRGDPNCVREAEHWARQCAIHRPGSESTLMLVNFLMERGSYAESNALLADLLQKEPSNAEARKLMLEITEARRKETGGR